MNVNEKWGDIKVVLDDTVSIHNCQRQQKVYDIDIYLFYI